MKTISEMQLLIKEAYAKLDELSKNLSEYNVSSDTHITIDFEKLKVIGKRNPIEGHALKRADPLTKKSYITLLIALVYLAAKNQEKGWLLIQRIACGAKEEHDFSALSADALILTEKQLDNFTESIVSENLRTAFVLDCMLVYLSCEHENSNMIEFISALMELVKCTEAEAKECTRIAKSIATQNEIAFFEQCFKNMSVNLIESICYIMPTKATVVRSIEEAMMITSGHVIIFNAVIKNLKTPINLDKFSAETIEFLYCKFENIVGIQSKTRKVIFKNAIFSNNSVNLIDDNDDNYEQEFNESFITSGDIKKSFIDIRNCEFLKCEFENCTTISKQFIFIQNGSMNNCFFRGGTIVDSSPENHLIELINGNIEKCKFEQCSIKTDHKNSRMTTTSSLVKLTQGSIRNTKFIDCRIDGESGYGRYGTFNLYILFLKNSNAKNCEFSNCSCDSSQSDNSITRKNYMIALQNSKQTDNSFVKCFMEQYAGWSTENNPIGTIE
ncbi:MAG: hypothetical protein E6713_07415 [Sporomusaceae bacterium]|nr:hypothetical protein [Sporomusaceae bacterium]